LRFDGESSLASGPLIEAHGPHALAPRDAAQGALEQAGPNEG
jgi:hypothetical protein